MTEPRNQTAAGPETVGRTMAIVTRAADAMTEAEARALTDEIRGLLDEIDSLVEPAQKPATEQLNTFDSEGMSIRAIASAWGVGSSTVHRDLASQPGYRGDEDGMIRVGSARGLDGKVRPSRRFDTTGRDALIVRRYADGLSMRAVAAEAGCSVGTVHRVLARAWRGRP